MHEVAPDNPMYFPALQLKGAKRLRTGYVRCFSSKNQSFNPYLVQVLTEVAPGAPLNFPAAQLTQAGESSFA